MGKCFGIVFSWIVFCCIVSECRALKGVRIDVPPAVILGHKATLYCLFDLEDDKLYSVKWYRGNAEFFRYSPGEVHLVKTFKIKGFHVVEHESNATQVVLQHVTRAISGKFSCEITTDQPGFLTEMRTATLEVVEVPKKDPYITSLKMRYKIGEILKGNCTSEKSNPAANLTWYLNGRQLNGSQIRKYKREVDGYITTSVTLRLKTTEEIFEKGKIKLRCSATMFNVYHRSSERSIELERKSPHRNSVSWDMPVPTSEDPPGRQIGYRNPEATLIFEENLYSPKNSDGAATLLAWDSLVLTLSILLFYQR